MNKEQSKEYLLQLLPKGSTVYTNRVRTSRSGMEKEIKVFTAINCEILNITGNVANVCDYKKGKDYGIIVKGCGFDPGYEIVCSIGYHLHGDEEALIQREI